MLVILINAVYAGLGLHMNNVRRTLTSVHHHLAKMEAHFMSCTIIMSYICCRMLVILIIIVHARPLLQVNSVRRTLTSVRHHLAKMEAHFMSCTIIISNICCRMLVILIIVVHARLGLQANSVRQTVLILHGHLARMEAHFMSYAIIMSNICYRMLVILIIVVHARLGLQVNSVRRILTSVHPHLAKMEEHV